MSKESHQFSTDAAKKVGVNAAIIFGHLIFLHKANLNRQDSWDGFRYWIKKTARAFEAMYPYLSQKEIRGALDRLQKEGYVLSVAGLSENKFDRAKSFSIEQSGFDLYEIEDNERHVFTCDKRANGSYPKGKSDVDERANQMLTKGQMNNSYNSYSHWNNIKEERVPANADLSLKKSIEPIDEAFTPVDALSKKRKNAPGAEKEKKVEALPALDFSRFDNPEAAKEIFTRWLKYRKDIKHPYKSEDTIQTSLKNLFNYSAGRAALAEQIIEKSIGNGYQGFFKPDAAPVAKKVGINHFGGDQSKYLEKQLF
jgi:hypothetical protein